MKYQSELIKEIVEARGHKQSSLHYESECIESWLAEAKGAYPKLCDYESEWLSYISILDDTGGGEDPEPPIGEFPYETITDVTEATVDNVVPLAYKSAVLKGLTMVNIINSNRPSYNFIDYNLSNVDSAKTYYVKFETSVPVSEIGMLMNASTWNVNISDVNSTNGYVILTPNKNKPISALRVRFDANTDKAYIPSANLLCIEYREGMENWNIPYFEGMQSVEMPVLTTSNEDGTKTNILRVNEDVTLCGIGDVHDTLDCLTGEVTERIGEMVLNGSETWKGPYPGGATVEGMYYYTYEDTRIKRNTTTNVLTTISYGGFASIPFNSVWKKTQEGISSSNSTGLGLRLATKIASAAELKSYLQQNPTTLKYQLATESIIKTVELNIQDQNGKTLSVIKPFEGTMHLSTSSDTIKPLFSGEIPVEAITQNLASFIDLEMEE